MFVRAVHMFSVLYMVLQILLRWISCKVRFMGFIAKAAGCYVKLSLNRAVRTHIVSGQMSTMLKWKCVRVTGTLVWNTNGLFWQLWALAACKHFPRHLQFWTKPVLGHVHKAIITTELNSKETACLPKKGNDSSQEGDILENKWQQPTTGSSYGHCFVKCEIQKNEWSKERMANARKREENISLFTSSTWQETFFYPKAKQVNSM